MKTGKPIAMLLLATLCAGQAAYASAAWAADPQTSPEAVSDTGYAGPAADTKGGITDPDKYDTAEIYVQYTNGTDELITLADGAELENAFDSLLANPDVLWFQPNYSYESASQILDP